ncbi:MAG: tRNA pseudouridine(38-40) synthase TruA [Pseudomonadota bacterium]
MQRYALIIEYDGTNYCGWQMQTHSSSVQARVEQALTSVADQTVTVVASGRTDTAVHAFAQCAHFDTDAKREHKAWVLGVNARLPADISIRSVTAVPDDFHARYSTCGRTYRYSILNRSARSALMRQRQSVIYPRLNTQAMHSAAQCLIGEHDFSSFRAAGCQAKHAVREITSVSVHRHVDQVTVEICGNAFLHNMVRIIVGSLIRVGTGVESDGWLRHVLQLRDRTRAGATAPAQGLYFMGPDYPPEFGIPDWRNALPLGPF